MPATGYPPPDHIFRDLGVGIDVPTATTARARFPVTPQLSGADGGARVGVLAVLVDLAAGAAAVRSLHPDWMATADLSVQLAAPVLGPWVEARASVVRRGRTTLVVEAALFDVAGDHPPDAALDGGDEPVPWSDPQSAPGAQVGMGTVTMAVLPARPGGPELPADPTFPAQSAFGTGALRRALADVTSVRVLDGPAGRLSMPVVPYVHNSFGAAQGGVMALLGELAGLAAVDAAASADRTEDAGGSGVGGVVTDLEVAYLALGRVGPILSEARVLSAAADGSGHADVELRDAGADDRLTTRVLVAVAGGRDGPGPR